jgi:ferric-dicitrate binding protein FerR (iron transport regulator)
VKPVSEQQLPPLSWYDREKVINTLKAALAQGRLTKDEHDARAAQASAAQSRAELAPLTADLPADLTARLPTARDAWAGVCGCIAAVGVLAALVLWGPDNFLAFVTALSAAATVLLAPPITVGLVIDARHQRRSGRSFTS